MLTCFLGINREFIEFVGHALSQALAIDLDLIGISNLTLTHVDLEWRVGDVVAITVNIHKMFTNLTWSEGDS